MIKYLSQLVLSGNVDNFFFFQTASSFGIELTETNKLSTNNITPISNYKKSINVFSENI